ncbi:hypothetical protein PB1_03520 [Bacillus methanolicus PB1]|uniref:UPF0342 protein PB1_03520 n=1 Tax=Bacillus methanolicus PB1 TaxID=997296 RepID=I3E656_BACMT|nr:YlbF family regulator [Bacillus methanolicus]EIJ81977.1 hypothetical protein PB1_03520 [Bacillus methanolicus PB1]
MAVNLYDSAYAMENAIRRSEEYVLLRKFYKEVNEDESARRMFENFRNIQLQLQEKQMMAQEITQEEIEHVQKAAALVQQHDKISKLIEAEQRMSMIITQLNEIIMKPLEELYGNPSNY